MQVTLLDVIELASYTIRTFQLSKVYLRDILMNSLHIYPKINQLLQLYNV